MDKISAFMDGEASRIEAHQTISALKQHEVYREMWQTFHLIGDVMRGDHPALREDFHARFRASMNHEPTLLAPRMTWRKSGNLALSAAASFVAVAVVLTLLITDNPLQPQPQIAAAPKPEITQVTQTPAPQPVPAVNQARVHGYLMAHQEYSPSTTIQGVAPYVRTVSAAQGDSGR